MWTSSRHLIPVLGMGPAHHAILGGCLCVLGHVNTLPPLPRWGYVQPSRGCFQSQDER